MNINSRIDWKDGMALSAQTFIELDNNISRRQQAASMAVNGSQFGIIPYTEFKAQGRIVRNKLEIENLTCMALVPSGKILHVEENVVVPVPLVYGDEYYLACGMDGSAEKKFDIRSVPFTRPENTFGIYPLNELEGTEKFPVMKFKVNNGIFEIDDTYIPPCLHLLSDSRFEQHISRLAEKVSKLALHGNWEPGDGKRAFQRYAYLLSNYDIRTRTDSFIRLTTEIAQAADYYIVSPNAETRADIPQYTEYDIVKWLDWLNGYLHNAVTILDKVVIEDHTIDFDELKAQIKAELYEKLYPELYENISNELNDKLYRSIYEEVRQKLAEHVNTQLKNDLHRILSEELSENLFEKLYRDLYDSLYNALYIPVEKEENDEFTPLI